MAWLLHHPRLVLISAISYPYQGYFHCKRSLAWLFTGIALFMGLVGLTVPRSWAQEPSLVMSPGQSRVIAVCDTGLLVDLCASMLQIQGAYVHKTLPLIHAVAVALPPTITARSIARLKGIVRIDPDTLHVIQGEIEPWNILKVQPQPQNGPSPARNVYTGRGVKVGILDTGIERDHPDLIDQIAGGYDALGEGNWNDTEGHGTHVSGIIAAGKNGTGIVGISPEASLYAVRVLDGSGQGYTSDIIDGITWCLEQGCQILNLSFGSPEYNLSFQEAIRKVYAAGVLLIAGAGNSSSETILFPAGYAGVLSVASTDETDHRSSSSNRGASIAMAAPGTAIYSTYRGKSYATLSGTSMAAAHVTGLAALCIEQLSVIPAWAPAATGASYTPEDVYRRLLRSARDLGPPGWDPSFGYGLSSADFLLSSPAEGSLR